MLFLLSLPLVDAALLIPCVFSHYFCNHSFHTEVLTDIVGGNGNIIKYFVIQDFNRQILFDMQFCVLCFCGMLVCLISSNTCHFKAHPSGSTDFCQFIIQIYLDITNKEVQRQTKYSNWYKNKQSPCHIISSIFNNNNTPMLCWIATNSCD